MNKDVLIIGAVIAFLFVLTAAGHFAFNGGGHEGAAAPGVDGPVVAVFATEEECQEHTQQECALQICDQIPPGTNIEDVCGQGYKEGWKPKEPAAAPAESH